MLDADQGIWSYRNALPTVPPEHRVTLGEGRTPLIRSAAIGEAIGLPNLYFKLESLNPTGSYKDRISAMAVSLAKANGKSACIGTTSGNAGASFAAYAARSGLTYHVYVQENIVPAKLEQILVHRAQVRKVRGLGFDPVIGAKVFDTVQRKASENRWEPAITAFAYAPLAMEAVKTISWEIRDDLGVPDAVFVPVGGGGLLAGIYGGFRDLLAAGKEERTPRMAACQSVGCSNVVSGFEDGSGRPAPGHSTSQISGIQVPNPPDAELVFRALAESAGFGIALEDETTWRWQEELAAKEGIFAEPAGAIALAGAAQAAKEGRLRREDTVVCIVSGAGYKDADRLHRMVAPHLALPLQEADRL